MKWGKDNLSHLSKNDIYFIGNGYNETLDKKDPSLQRQLNSRETLTPRSSSLDFALLATCNHTIASRGTYTIFASRYAGGHIITEFSQGYEKFKEGYNYTIKPTKQGRDVSEL